MTELKIGETGIVEGKKVKCIKGGSCKVCVFNKPIATGGCLKIKCTEGERTDKTPVYFEEVKE